MLKTIVRKFLSCSLGLNTWMVSTGKMKKLMMAMMMRMERMMTMKTRSMKMAKVSNFFIFVALLYYSHCIVFWVFISMYIDRSCSAQNVSVRLHLQLLISVDQYSASRICCPKIGGGKLELTHSQGQGLI